MTPQFTLSVEPTDDDDTISVSSSTTGDSFFKSNSIQEMSSNSDSELSEIINTNVDLTQDTSDLVNSLLLMRQLEISARDLIDSTPKILNQATQDLDTTITDIQIESSAQDLNIYTFLF